LATAGAILGIALVAYLALYRGLPRVLARWAIAILPDDQMGYARAELAIWDHEDHNGLAGAAIRREFHQQLDTEEGAPWHWNQP
jgi:hypothetical protein